MLRDPQSLLIYEAKKRPALSEIMNNIDKTTFEEIEALSYLKWIRQALANHKRTKARQEQSRDAQANAEAWLDQHAPDGSTERPEPSGRTFRWTDQPRFIRFNASLLEITTGKLLWFPNDGGMLSDGMFSPTIDPTVWRSVQSVSVMTRSAYMHAVDRQVMISGTATTISNDPMSAVRISRVPDRGSGW